MPSNGLDLIASVLDRELEKRANAEDPKELPDCGDTWIGHSIDHDGTRLEHEFTCNRVAGHGETDGQEVHAFLQFLPTIIPPFADLGPRIMPHAVAIWGFNKEATR